MNTETHATNPSGKLSKPTGVFLGALLFGFMTGLLEGTTYLLARVTGLMGWKIHFCARDLNILLVVTLVDVTLFLVVGVMLWVALRVLRRWAWSVIATGVYATLMFYAVISVPGRLGERGAMMLALGLGVVAARWVAHDIEGRMRLMRRAFVPLLLLSLVVCLAGASAPQVWDRVSQAGLPAAPDNAPNVLFIVLDTLRADHMSLYGYERPTTPFLGEYARRSVLFENTFANSSWTLPSHVSMFTGLMPQDHKATEQTYDGRFATVAQALAARGYATTGVVANSRFATCSCGVGLGFQHYEDSYITEPAMLLKSIYFQRLQKYSERFFGWDIGPKQNYISANEVGSRFLRWLDHRPDRPFLAFLNFMSMHRPYTAPAALKVLRGERDWNLTRHPEALGAGYTQRARDAYDAALIDLDQQLRALFEEMERRQLDKNTLVIITSDHGEMLGEHGLYDHRHSLYQEELRVPLIIRMPGRTPAGLRVRTPSGLNQLPATIAELTGLVPGIFPGASLVGYWSGQPPQDAEIVSEVSGGQWPGVSKDWPIYKGSLSSVMDSRWHFILIENGEAELFDRAADPHEQNNLSQAPAWEKLVRRYRQQLVGSFP